MNAKSRVAMFGSVIGATAFNSWTWRQHYEETGEERAPEIGERYVGPNGDLCKCMMTMKTPRRIVVRKKVLGKS